MSKKEVKPLVVDGSVTRPMTESEVADLVLGVTAAPLPPTPQPVQPLIQERIPDEDMKLIELAKAHLETANAQAKEAAAKLETATIAYRYTILQVYMKNGLGVQDALGEDGSIVRNGATQQR